MARTRHCKRTNLPKKMCRSVFSLPACLPLNLASGSTSTKSVERSKRNNRTRHTFFETCECLIRVLQVDFPLHIHEGKRIDDLLLTRHRNPVAICGHDEAKRGVFLEALPEVRTGEGLGMHLVVTVAVAVKLVYGSASVASAISYKFKARLFGRTSRGCTAPPALVHVLHPPNPQPRKAYLDPISRRLKRLGGSPV